MIPMMHLSEATMNSHVHSAFRRGILAFAAAALWMPGHAFAHGGTTVAEGQSGGVTVLVQGSDSSTKLGKPAVDLATTLAGPGTGTRAKVLFYVRPEGKASFRVAAQRDDSGVRHAEIATTGRGQWRDWDVSAIVTLSNGKRLRVANVSSNPPGPDPSQARAPKQRDEAPAEATSPQAEAPLVDEQPVSDISGNEAQAPAWVVPSLIGLVLLGLAGLALVRRRRDHP